MKVLAAHPFAHLMGLPIRRKAKPSVKPQTRRRESRTAPSPVRRTLAAKAVAHGNHFHKRTFAELLDAAPVETRALKHRPLVSAPVHVEAPTSPLPTEVPPSRGQLTAAARRIIALSAEARGESLPADGIEAQMQRERDQACGITPTARAIIDRKAVRA